MISVGPKKQTGLVLVTMVAVVAVLHFAEDVLVPVALALMMAFLLAPLVSRVERWGANRPVAVALTTLGKRRRWKWVPAWLFRSRRAPCSPGG